MNGEVFKVADLVYSVLRRGDRVFHREEKRDAQGHTLAANEAEVRYVLGSGRRGFAFLVERANGLFQSPISWYAQEGRWDLAPRYAEFIGNEIQKAYLESYSDYGQNLFDRYVDYADAWIEDLDFKDPDTGQMMNRELLNQELTKIEKPAGIANPKDFRNEVVKFSLRSRAANGGKNPGWTSYEKIREVIEKRIFSQVEDLLPVISFGSKKDSETEKKHGEFVARMVERGYTERQVRRLVEWYMRVKQAG